MPENEISTEYVPDDDDAQSYVEFLEQEMTRVKEKLKYSIPGTEEYLNASQAFEKISTAYRNLFDHYYSEESDPNGSGEENREKVSSFYAEETKRKENCMNKSQKQIMAQLEENIAECNALMKHYPVGSDEYNKAAEYRTSFAREYCELLKTSSEQKNEFWDRVKWIGNILKDLAVVIIPLAVYVVLFHQSLDFESTGSYRARTTSNLVSKMTPKGLQA